MPGRHDGTSFFFELAVCWIIASSAIAQDTEFQSRQVTPAGEYTLGIEGPAVDQEGNLYVVNLGKPGTIEKLAAGAMQSELFAVLPEGSVGKCDTLRSARRACSSPTTRDIVFFWSVRPGKTSKHIAF